MSDDPGSTRRFIGEPITAAWDEEPALLKTPTCPDRFSWQGETFEIVELLSEWSQFERRGRMARNMRPEHAIRAAQRGSWGVGQFTFRVRTAGGRVFEIMYDRKPRDADHRAGGWIVYTEVIDDAAPEG